MNSADYKITGMTLGMVGTNCYCIYDSNGTGVFIDPADRGGFIADKLGEMGIKLSAVLLTHGHFDHMTGAAALCEKTGAKAYCLDKEKDLIMNPSQNVSLGFCGEPITFKPDGYVSDGQWLTFSKEGMEISAEEKNGFSCQVIATPGHTVGGCCFYFKSAGVLFSGDTLFEESVGRSDFPTGSMSTLVRSVKERLFVLPDETIVYPGHNGDTTIGHEKKYNPFCG